MTIIITSSQILTFAITWWLMERFAQNSRDREMELAYMGPEYEEPRYFTSKKDKKYAQMRAQDQISGYINRVHGIWRC